jgi:PAS domain S-box-containing protein
MLDEPLQDLAVNYVSGGLTATQRECLEVILEFHHELKAQVRGLQGVVTSVVMETVPRVTPPESLKARLLGTLAGLPPVEPEGWVATDPAGLVEWVNPAFTTMCGYTLEELKGRKPGHLLQGPATDPDAVERIRRAVSVRTACRETLVNYHKDGSPYHVEVCIDPILDDEGQPLWFVARERKLSASGVVATR